MRSPEGIAWSEYNLPQLALMAPFGVPVGLYLEMVWKLSKQDAHIIGAEDLPENAILYDFHIDVATNFITMHLLAELGKKAIFSGYHGFMSYSSFGPGSMGAYHVWRYDRRLKIKPFDQMVAMLKAKPDRILGIFTDAGGPYFKVRDSLPRLAIATGRPLVPFRSLYDPSVLILNQMLPAPRVKGKSLFGKPILAGTLNGIALEERPRFLEQKLREVSDQWFPKT